MIKRSMALFSIFIFLVATFVAVPTAAFADQTVATAGVGGTYPPGATFVGVTINGMESGFGAELNLDGTGAGQICDILLGTSSLGLAQNITVEGEVTSGSRLAPNVAVLTGMATVN